MNDKTLSPGPKVCSNQPGAPDMVAVHHDDPETIPADGRRI